MDQMFGVELIADCELLIKAGPIQRGDYSYIAEDILVRRSHRTVDAFLKVMNDDPTLGGRFTPRTQPPVIRLSEVFVGHGDAQKGGASSPRWLFQIARVILRFARLEQAY